MVGVDPVHVVDSNALAVFVSRLLNRFTFNLKVGTHPDQAIPPSFTDLLKRMLHLDCDQRITPLALLEHPFMCSSVSEEQREAPEDTTDSGKG